MSATVEPDHYATLGVTPSASADEVRSAYRVRARLFHPDAHVGAAPSVKAEADRLFADLNAAYRVLSNVNLRAAYDRAATRPGQATVADDEPDMVDRFVDEYSSAMATVTMLAGVPTEVAETLFTQAIQSMPRFAGELGETVSEECFQQALAYQMTKHAFWQVHPRGKRLSPRILGSAYWALSDRYRAGLPIGLVRYLDDRVPRSSLPQGPLKDAQRYMQNQRSATAYAAKSPSKSGGGRRISGWLVAGAIGLIVTIAGAVGGKEAEPVDAINGFAVGDCISEMGNSPVKVGCGTASDNYVYATRDLYYDSWPGSDEITRVSDPFCESRLGSSSDWSWNYWYPSQESWSAGDRTVVCVRTEE